jgi:hypothetical protein
VFGVVDKEIDKSKASRRAMPRAMKGETMGTQNQRFLSFEL